MIRSPAIRAIVAGLALLDAEIAEATPSTGDVYTTEALPPLTSRRTFHTRCRRGEIPGAMKTGRSWSCPRAAWHAARSRRPALTLRLVEGVPQTDRERARGMLAAAGFRSTR